MEISSGWLDAPTDNVTNTGTLVAMLKALGGSRAGAALVAAAFAVHRAMYRRCESCGAKKRLEKSDITRSVWVQRVGGQREHVVNYPGRLCMECVMDGFTKGRGQPSGQ